MDFEDLDPIDILAFTTDELRNRFTSATDLDDQKSVIQGFLENWDTDPALGISKKLKVAYERDLDWFNTSHALTTEQLHGKIVVLDFFTYCCINCMHVFPELKALEEMFSIEDGLVVIGVHSPKFENEKDSANILAAIQRYNITHPIVNDARSLLWNNLHIKCWPTLLVLSPTGCPMLLLMGEGHRLFLAQFIDQALEYFSKKQQIQNFSLPLRLSSDERPASSLKFPAKIACFQGVYAIADAGNHRILVVDKRGLVLYRIGGCAAGFVNGNLAEARFHAPQGVAFVSEDILVVADTENHAIRQIFLSEGRVITLAGTGNQGADRVGGNVGAQQQISSPWDVSVFKTRDMDMSFHMDEQKVPEKTIILIAMAGTHQIWGYFPEGAIWWKFKKFDPLTCASLIGNGLEENRNNSYPQNAAFAQPSGLAIANEFLFVADSESSSVRKVSMVDGKVMPVVGGDRNPLNLFAFGDVDGKQFNAKLQHPLGVAYNQSTNKVYVTDTYNHKIKVIDVETNTVETCHVQNEHSKEHRFNEPAGLCCSADGRQLLVADTNNHNIQLIDLSTMKTVPFNIDFGNVHNTADANAAMVLNGVKLHKSLLLYGCKRLKLNVRIMPDDGFKFTQNAPQKWHLNASNFVLSNIETSDGQLQQGACKLELQRITNAAADTVDGAEVLSVDFSLNLCDDKSCVIRKFSLILTNDFGTTPSKVAPESVNEELELFIKKSGITISD